MSHEQQVAKTEENTLNIDRMRVSANAWKVVVVIIGIVSIIWTTATYIANKSNKQDNNDTQIADIKKNQENIKNDLKEYIRYAIQEQTDSINKKFEQKFGVMDKKIDRQNQTIYDISLKCDRVERAMQFVSEHKDRYGNITLTPPVR